MDPYQVNSTIGHEVTSHRFILGIKHNVTAKYRMTSSI